MEIKSNNRIPKHSHTIYMYVAVCFVFCVGFFSFSHDAVAGEVWTTRSSAADNNWTSVTYGNGLFVAVAQSGTGNRVMTSPDGITWTSRTSSADKKWFSVTYGNGLFVAICSDSTDNLVMTSPDGITWTSRTSASNNTWRAVTYGNGLFVAVSNSGVGNRVMTSPDGITWTSRTSAADNNWFGVTYGNGLFVAVASGGTNRVMTSPDGITWTARTSADEAGGWWSVTYGNGLFVAVAYTGGTRVMTSPDGITWTGRTAAAANNWHSVTYGNGLFVAVAYVGTNRIMTSPDGITWTARTSPVEANEWYGVTYNNGLFVAVSNTGTGNRVMTSPYNPIGGTLYSDEGITPITSSKIIKMAVSTSSTPTVFSTTTNTSGVWRFNQNFNASSSSSAKIMVWVDNDMGGVYASLFTKASTSVWNISNLPLYQNRIIISHEATTSTSTTIADLAFYDSDNDSDIQFNASSTAQTLNINTGNKLYIAPSKNFVPGGSVTVHGNAGSGVDGSLHVADGATYVGGATTSVAGNFTASSSATITNYGVLAFTATTTGKTILAPHALGNLTFMSSSGAWTFASSATTTNLNIVSGIVTAPSSDLTITGDYTNYGTFTHNSGTTTFSSTTAQTLSGTMTGTSAFNTLVFDSSGIKTFSSNASTIDFTIRSGSTAVAPTELTLTGDYMNNGTFSADTGTVILNGTSQQTLIGTMVGTSAFRNLTIANISGAGSTSQSIVFTSSASTTDMLTMLASTSVQFFANSTSTFQDIHLGGETGRYVYLRSSSNNTQYGFYVPGTQSMVSYVNVRDSNACPVSVTTSQSINAGNNNCWVFPSPPVLSTPTNTSVKDVSAVLGATVLSDGSAVITERGTCWGTSPSPTTNCVADGDTTTGIFSHLRTGLSAGTTYYYRGYAVNSYGTGYSEDGTFTTRSVLYTDSSGLNARSWPPYVGGYTVEKFTSSGTFIAPEDVSTYEVLVAAGGGGGGKDGLNGTSAGGGGAGGLVYHANKSFTPGTGYTVTIGGGGAGSTNNAANGGNGSNSSIGDITAVGGGGGASVSTSHGSNGGSGGGGEGSGGVGGSSTQGSSGGGTGYGNAGAAGAASTYGTGGGGAGAGAAGSSINDGNGRQYSISGTSTYYGGGGAGRSGSSPYTVGTAGLGGGGGNGVDGTANTGGGGGFGGAGGGGNGGSGIVIVRYPYISPIQISSELNQEFGYDQATTTISTISIVDTHGNITASDDIRVRIATTSVNMRWDTTDTSAVFGGTASGKVGNPVSYEDNGATLVIPVSSSFSMGDTLTVSGLSFKDFLAVNVATTALGIRITGVGATTEASDSKTVAIYGSLTLADHSSGQVSDNFDITNQTNTHIYAFRLTPGGENMDVTSLAFSIRGIRGVTSGDVTNAILYRDMNGNKTVDGSDVAIGGGGNDSINNQSGTITFSTTFQATTTQDFLLVADFTDLKARDALVISLSGTEFAVTGVITGNGFAYGSLSAVQHIKGGGGGGGSGANIGEAPPAGDGTRTGGDEGGGGGVDPNSGDTIGSETGANAPAGNGSPHGAWTNGGNAYTSDGSYATAGSASVQHSYGNFGFSVPSNNTITGIKVKLEAHGTGGAGETISARLSWDGGSSVTLLKTTSDLTATDVVYELGGSSDTWGRVWSPSDFNNGSFAIEVVADDANVSVDAIQVRVYHQATGGGGGGGGAVYRYEPGRFFANAYSALGGSVGEAIETFIQWLAHCWS